MQNPKKLPVPNQILPLYLFGGDEGTGRGWDWCSAAQTTLGCTATRNLRRHNVCLLHRELCSCACLFLACAQKTQTPLHLQKEGTVIDFVAECLKLPFPWKQREPYHNTPNWCGWTGTNHRSVSAAQRQALRVTLRWLLSIHFIQISQAARTKMCFCAG